MFNVCIRYYILYMYINASIYVLLTLEMQCEFIILFCLIAFKEKNTKQNLK